MFFCLFVFLLVHKHGVRNVLKYIQQLYIKYQWLTFFNAPINISHFLWIIKTIRMQIKRVRKWTDAHTDISSSKYCRDPQMHVFKKACISACVFRLLLHLRQARNICSVYWKIFLERVSHKSLNKSVYSSAHFWKICSGPAHTKKLYLFCRSALPYVQQSGQ